MKKILHETLPIMQCTCSLRQSLGHTLSLSRINYAYITIIIKYKFNDNVCMAGACSSERAWRVGSVGDY